MVYTLITLPSDVMQCILMKMLKCSNEGKNPPMLSTLSPCTRRDLIFYVRGIDLTSDLIGNSLQLDHVELVIDAVGLAIVMDLVTRVVTLRRCSMAEMRNVENLPTNKCGGKRHSPWCSGIQIHSSGSRRTSWTELEDCGCR